jgi:hypothetical protein
MENSKTIMLTTRQWVQPIYCLGGFSKPNLKWEFTDSAGHIHKWEPDGSLPTLNRVEDTEYHSCDMSDEDYYCCDGYEETITTYFCKECGEEVKPGYYTDMSPLYQYGEITYYINNVPVSKEEFDQASLDITSGEATH